MGTFRDGIPNCLICLLQEKKDSKEEVSLLQSGVAHHELTYYMHSSLEICASGVN